MVVLHPCDAYRCGSCRNRRNAVVVGSNHIGLLLEPAYHLIILIIEGIQVLTPAAGYRKRIQFTGADRNRLGYTECRVLTRQWHNLSCFFIDAPVGSIGELNCFPFHDRSTQKRILLPGCRCNQVGLRLFQTGLHRNHPGFRFLVQLIGREKETSHFLHLTHKIRNLNPGDTHTDCPNRCDYDSILDFAGLVIRRDLTSKNILVAVIESIVVFLPATRCSDNIHMACHNRDHLRGVPVTVAFIRQRTHRAVQIDEGPNRGIKGQFLCLTTSRLIQKLGHDCSKPIIPQTACLFRRAHCFA